MERLDEIRENIIIKHGYFDNVFIEDNILIIEQSYDMGIDEKNDDDCCDEAKENGELIIKEFPELEIVNCYCHRHKYAVVELKYSR